MEKILTPVVVVAVALIDADGFILMQQRHLSAAHGGLWEFPGGKIEPGETPEFAAARELDEELGIGLKAGVLKPIGIAEGLTAAADEGGMEPQRPLVIHLYAAREWSGVPHVRDAEAIAWCRPDAIRHLSMPPLDYPLADALCRYLGVHSS
ncbi:MAG TPA: (deoxy)nucleoside triphosphate pyrophosphohydrolase [Novosphingobium sp.]|nr:(deoxy)nucleoside triphosphate pyrophosphohydrolase [Novosphingobium sp.]HKR92300.1 (deoxy)nucleoside triphosphate pyrophosphohydrolase [Novosphingobium sp.]